MSPLRVRSRSKYGAVKTTIDGYTFASQKEARRYQELKLLARAGRIADLQVHPTFDLYAARPIGRQGTPTALVGRYTADFSYQQVSLADLSYRRIVEDVKGGKATRTEAYRLRKKIFEANYGLTVTEI